LEVEPDDSVVVSLASKSPAEKIAYAAVARGPGEPVAWHGEGNMEMNRYGVETEALTSDSYFVLRLRNASGKAITALILNPGTPGEKTYPVEIPSGPERRNLGLYPYETGTTLAVRLAGGALRSYNALEFGSDPVSGFRYADLPVGP
jgi:hypothetical protein